jgi:hypothetical protein
VNRWVAAYPFLGFVAALLFLAPNSIDDFPRALISTAIVVVVGVTTYLYIRFRTRHVRNRATALGERFPLATTVKVDPDSLELAAHIAGVEPPRAGVFTLTGDTDGIRLFSSTTEADIALRWADVTTVDLNPSSLGERANIAISVYTRVSPRLAINLVAQSRYGILRPRIEAVGQVIARLRELQGR